MENKIYCDYEEFKIRFTERKTELKPANLM